MPDPEKPDEDRVSDEETLYRSIRPVKECFSFDEEGALRVSAQAFADRKMQPSLFRKHLCDAPPYSDPPRLGPDQVVVSLIAGKIRENSPLQHQSEKQEPVRYLIDVRPDTSDNQHRAHAIVFTDPEFKTKGAFEKLKIRLALLVEEWAIQPETAFVEELRRLKG
jgi:hypothetical protein